jgi:L-2-hydroxyglutarate oxidase
MIYDFCIIGGGIVGLATAMKLQEARPGASVLVLEKEDALGRHQTGHNSGVIHAGIYYKPGSLKAELCRAGARATVDFCSANGVPFEICGKLLVATSPLELERMEALVGRARENRIGIERLNAAELREREPGIAGMGALFVSSTGIVDYKQVCAAMSDVIRRAGGVIALGKTVAAIRETASDVTIATSDESWTAKKLIVCGGLQSDRLARLAGMKIDHQIVPFRGEYFKLGAAKRQIVKHLIYPIPDPDLPFLGIHLTRMINGDTTVGPNAVLGFAREGYPKFSFNARDVAAGLAFPGVRRMLARNWKSGLREMENSLIKSRYLEACRKYCPSLELDDLLPIEAGIRAQAVRRDGSLVDDFMLLQTDRMLHVCNAPSPAATSAIPIGAMIVEKALGAA